MDPEFAFGVKRKFWTGTGRRGRGEGIRSLHSDRKGRHLGRFYFDLRIRLHRRYGQAPTKCAPGDHPEPLDNLWLSCATC